MKASTYQSPPSGQNYVVGKGDDTNSGDDITYYPFGFTFDVLFHLMTDVKAFFCKAHATKAGGGMNAVSDYAKRELVEGIPVHGLDFDTSAIPGFKRYVHGTMGSDTGSFSNFTLDFSKLRSKKAGGQMIYYPKFDFSGYVYHNEDTENPHKFSSSNKKVGDSYQPNPPIPLFILLPKWAVPYADAHIQIISTDEIGCLFTIPMYSDEFIHNCLVAISETYSCLNVTGAVIKGQIQSMMLQGNTPIDPDLGVAKPFERDSKVFMQYATGVMTNKGEFVSGRASVDEDGYKTIFTLARPLVDQDYPVILKEEQPPASNNSMRRTTINGGYIY